MVDKYKWKLRILYIETPSYQDPNYIDTKKNYEKNIKIYHKYFLKMITKRNKNLKFKIKLIGFDGKVKHTYNKMNKNKIIKDIEKMPMGNLKNIEPINLSLYADYNKKTSNKNFGFKNKEKALETLKLLKNEPIKYQKSVVTTMIGRADNHPHQTKDMREAIKVFKNWLKNN